MLAVIKALQKTYVTCMASRSAPTILSRGRLFSDISRSPTRFPIVRRSDVMSGSWGSLHSFLRNMASRPVAVAFGATTVGAGIWMASGHLGRRTHCASGAAGASGPRAVAAHVSDRPTPDTQESPSADLRTVRLMLAAGAAMIPHPAKADRGGEDAYFVCESGRCMGVADGVGGWAEIGIDPGLYSRELMNHAKEFALTMEPGADGPQQILEYAHRKTAARGSCTACILCVHDSSLHASNLGDSGFMVVRDGELAFMSPQQQHEFNFPYQLGSIDSMADMPSAAQRFAIDVQVGDIVVAATDGVFDNIYPDEAAAMVTLAKRNGDSPANAAMLLAQFARTRAADPAHLSPFAYGAQQLGYRYFGGKMDDITVVCAYIEEGKQAVESDGGDSKSGGET